MQKRFIKNYSRNFKKVNKKEPFLGQNRTGPKCAVSKTEPVPNVQEVKNMKVALVGNQNSGKTTLFNLLTGMNAKIGNWPGVTIEKKSGIIKSSQNNGVVCEITDLPGIYSLSPYSVEEEVSRRFIFDESPDVIVNIIDANCLERSLYLTTQLLELDCRVIVVLNMVDLLEKKGFSIDEHKLELLLGTRVIKVSALKGDGVDELLKEMFCQPSSIKKVNSLYIYDAKLEQAIVDIQSNLLFSKHKRFVAVKLLENDFRFNSNDLKISDSKFSQIQRIRDNLATEYDTDLEEIIATERYGFIEQVKPKVVHGIVQVDNLMSMPSISDKLDSIFLNKWLAIPIFIVIMFLVYYLSAGVVGKFTVDFIGDIVKKIKGVTQITLKKIGIANWLISLLVDGIISGVGSVIGFVPQLIILFTCIALLETTGYMSRIALLLDKIFRKIGLSGKSLIPFIVGAGCSVPAIMGTRIIENQDEREMTTILTPFIPCSAKLPIIVLFSSYFFKQNSGLVSVSLYFLSVMIIIASAIVMKKFIYINTSSTYISELPEYKIPNIKYIVRDVYDKTIAFFKRAGSVILICSIVIWFLLSFSINLEYGIDIENSILATIGKTISWVFYPILGVNSWGATVSAIQGLIAKEQVISSMSVIAGLSKTTESENQILNSQIFSFFTPQSAYAFMVFNLFSAPCFGAIGAMRKELGSIIKTGKVVIFQIILAWVLAVLINQLGINLIAIIVITLAIIEIIKKTKKSKQNVKRGCQYCSYSKDCQSTHNMV